MWCGSSPAPSRPTLRRWIACCRGSRSMHSRPCSMCWASRERALIGALRDDDPRTVRLALTWALEDCPPAALPLITQIVLDQTMTSELRVLAIKVLGRVGTTVALNALLQLADGGTSWLGRPKLAVRSLELLAALMALEIGRAHV